MRLVLIGKFPPIQGGVSTQTYWTAHRLAELGHDVEVVTNADAVEYGFRQLLLDDDRERLTTTSGSGSITVHATTPMRRSTIPSAAPFASQLLGQACEVVEDRGADAVLGWYFEPYGVVAAQVADTFDVPLILRHAGSDIGRLARNRELASAFRWMARRCRALLTGAATPEVRTILAGLGFSDNQCVPATASALPAVYRRRAAPLDLAALSGASRAWHAQVGIGKTLAPLVRQLDTGQYERDTPTIATYGKVGAVKGSYDLLAVLNELAREGVPFNFMPVVAGRSAELQQYFRTVCAAPALLERTWVLPPIAPWRIPAFLARCDVVCMLERGFPIPFHSSSEPREILASGRCLVLSTEMASKLPLGPNLVDGKNCVLVDPEDHTELTNAARRLLTDATHRSAIGWHGEYLSRFWEDELARLPGIAGQVDALMSSWSS